ncbi:RNA recognition motif-containing protein [Giardia muris]|uniref:RNA recognition motif-containing protein n=1 Tax=Giardia muris TaxID=5742 RepID=A0A4Z1SXC9_GIAMU|nr:RNA recognition motif-containing protein [Giardia muris]|eukprot:TNJ30356.1 RNA recognition motif-containing protein [Giardia muris]
MDPDSDVVINTTDRAEKPSHEKELDPTDEVMTFDLCEALQPKRKMQLSQGTLLISWRFEGAAPKIGKAEIDDVLKELSIPISVTNVRTFQHKVYADFKGILRKYQYGEIASVLSKRHEGVEFFARRDRVSSDEKTTVFLGNVIGLDAQDLAALVEKVCGFVPKAVRIPEDKRTGGRKPIAYVVCDTREEALQAAKDLQGQKAGLSSGLRTDLLVQEGDNHITLRQPRRKILE